MAAVFDQDDPTTAEPIERLHRCPMCGSTGVDVRCRCLLGDRHCRGCGGWYHVLGGHAVPGRGHA